MRFPLLDCFQRTLCGLLTGAAIASAATVNLSGTMYDKDNKPLPGVIVSLNKAGLSDTTGADGKWALLGTTTGVARAVRAPGAFWNGRTLDLTLANAATVQVESFDARGVRLGTLAQVHLEAGSHELPIATSRARGMNWLRLSINGQTQVIAAGSGTSVASAGLPGILGRTSSADSVDQLVYTLQGQLITADTVVNLIQAGLDKWVQEFSISGKVQPDARVTVDSVFAWFDGGRMSGMRRGLLGFSKSNNAYSGRLFTVKSLTGEIFNYRVWINVMANGNKRTGISDTTDFSSLFGAIDFIPAFAVGNAIPAGSITGPATGLVNTPLSFRLAIDRKDEQLAHIEWDLANGNGLISGKDTVTSLWLQPGSYGLQARLTDIDSNSIILTKIVNITNIGAVVAGLRDTTITPSDVVAFTMTASDTDGVANVLWNFGDGTKDSTFTGTTHTVSHKYPGIDSIEAGTSKMYPLTVTVVDKLGNTTSQVAQITVINDVPVVTVPSVVGEPDSLVSLHGKATDRGSIAKVEWSIDGTTFRAGAKDTSIKMPAAPTLNYPVYVRVTDEDGNVSKVDTVRAIIGKMITDTRDGQKYRIVTIGLQTWMAQNLNYKVDRSWWNKNNPDSGAKYGRLYNWASAMELNDSCNTKSCTNLVEPQHQGVCPVGWHVPSGGEWNTLLSFTEADPRVGRAKGALGLRATFGWYAPTYAGKDFFGFSAIGTCDTSFCGYFPTAGGTGYWWTGSELDTTRATLYYTFYYSFEFSQSSNFKSSIIPLRCIQDTTSVSLSGVPATAELGTQLKLRSLAKASVGIPKIEWSVNGGDFSGGGVDTTITLPSTQTLKYPVVVRATDETGKTVTDAANIGVFSFFTDERDGQKYRTVTIGSQTWMAQNLNYKVGSSWWYNNSVDNGAKYGRLYQWAAAMGLDSSCNHKSCANQVTAKHRGVCPEGWHVPSDSEWTTLTDTTLTASTAGTKLKANSNQWSQNTGADDFGFSVLPAGYRYNVNGSFGNLGNYGNFWLSSEDTELKAWNRNFGYGNDYVNSINFPKSNGYSLRCLQD